jgi:hypothetical protein
MKLLRGEELYRALLIREKTAFFGKAADPVIRYAFDLG